MELQLIYKRLGEAAAVDLMLFRCRTEDVWALVTVVHLFNGVAEVARATACGGLLYAHAYSHGQVRSRL